jgi:hypothetical protein
MYAVIIEREFVNSPNKQILSPELETTFKPDVSSFLADISIVEIVSPSPLHSR